ncbi:hypothetical protein PG985_002514 [Apiospora marii]|uniref:uncharacterized protein n=1 Tax=Apiospora marii TaxID=335849 RepID=UPI0031326FE4
MSISIQLQLELKERLGALTDSLSGSLPIDEAVLDGAFTIRHKLRINIKCYRREQSVLRRTDMACLHGHSQPR